MAIPVLIIGKSGAGKSTSMRNCINNDEWNLIKVLDKPLPFRGKIACGVTDDYQKLIAWITGSKAHSIVIDDAGYLITNQFMKNHSSSKGGNGAFAMYNDLADRFWNLTQFIINGIPNNKIVYETDFKNKEFWYEYDKNGNLNNRIDKYGNVSNRSFSS